MWINLSYHFVIPDHFYPLVKEWVGGLNILLDNLDLITPVCSAEDVYQQKVTFSFSYFSWVCQCVRPSVLYFFPSRRTFDCPRTFYISHPSLCNISALLCYSIRSNNQIKQTYVPQSSLRYRFKMLPKTAKTFLECWIPVRRNIGTIRDGPGPLFYFW